MKVRVFGDLHGLTTWQEIVKDDSYDMNVFLGDYVDSFTISDAQILDNLQKLIDYKKSNPDKVTLLWGNHDLMYYFLGNRNWQCS
jgi:metallophosphoesterase superfamily enzyme